MPDGGSFPSSRWVTHSYKYTLTAQSPVSQIKSQGEYRVKEHSINCSVWPWTGLWGWTNQLPEMLWEPASWVSRQGLEMGRNKKLLTGLDGAHGLKESRPHTVTTSY